MRSKKIITLISILAIVLVLFVVLVAVFALSDVVLVYYDQEGNAIATPTDDITPSSEALLNQFKGKSIFALNKYDVVDYVNTHYNGYHALAVVKGFPNSITVHLVKREEVYVINNGAQKIYLDSFGYVLEGRQDDTRALLDISNIFVTNSDAYTVGSKLHFASDIDNARLNMLIDTVNTVWSIKYSYADVPYLIQSIVFDATNSIMTITTTTNTKIVVSQPDVNLSKRLVKAFSVYSNDELNLQGGTITVPVTGNITTSY